jgi:hypothetical protein
MARIHLRVAQGCVDPGRVPQAAGPRNDLPSVLKVAVKDDTTERCHTVASCLGRAGLTADLGDRRLDSGSLHLGERGADQPGSAGDRVACRSPRNATGWRIQRLCHAARTGCSGGLRGSGGRGRTGDTLCRILDEEGIEREMVMIDPQRPTTVKERFMGRAAARHPNQILRVDSETREPLDRRLEDELVRSLQASIARYDAVLISDYGKGVCTTRVLRATLEAGRIAGVPVLVDPMRTDNFGSYRGATVLKPNRVETESATGCRIQRPEDAFRAGMRLCEQLDLATAIITLDRDGMALVPRRGEPGVVCHSTASGLRHYGCRRRRAGLVGHLLGAGCGTGYRRATREHRGSSGSRANRGLEGDARRDSIGTHVTNAAGDSKDSDVGPVGRLRTPAAACRTESGFHKRLFRSVACGTCDLSGGCRGDG